MSTTEANGCSAANGVDVEFGHKSPQPVLVGAVGLEKTTFQQPESSGMIVFLSCDPQTQRFFLDPVPFRVRGLILIICRIDL